ncbi:membrane-targeted effector domain-containing toxin [Herbaspirillum sp. YR522]|uniref:membrane-targeted effector domain-containing toxin n=1 Tax=Herbaspirillum sp. YR522 TaxID=1144342 RepID=UPI00026F9A74|nr:membrane-targeted effector domain-containing toxin [Herbaspirillum sp. YR522]EJM96089.1 hypothetical protein PMI40_04758 [Herbaspirillum sp. YR522]
MQTISPSGRLPTPHAQPPLSSDERAAARPGAHQPAAPAVRAGRARASASTVLAAPAAPTPATQAKASDAALADYLSGAFTRVFADYPSMHQSARDYARDFIAHRFNQVLDPDTTKLVLLPMHPRYVGPGTDTSYRRPVANQVQEERSLTELFVRNFDGNTAHLLRNLRQRHLGIYTDDDLKTADALIPAPGYDLHPDQQVEPSIRPSRISAAELYGYMKSSDGNRFPQQFQQELARFWTRQRTPFIQAQTELAHVHLDRAYFNQEITLSDWKDGHRAFAGTSLPHLDIRQLQLGTFTSHDSFLWSDRKNGRTVLYTPGEDKAFQAFDSLSSAQDWVSDKSQDIDWLKRFTQAHFSANDAGNRQGLLASPDVIGDALNLFSASGMEFGPKLSGNPFEALTDARAAKDVEDARFIMNSNADLNNSMLIHSMRLVPFIGAAAAIAIGKGSERTEGLVSLGLDVATGPVLDGLGAVAKAGAKGVAGAFKGTLKAAAAPSEAAAMPALKHSARAGAPDAGPLPFFRAPQRVNGQIGYPLSPNRVNPSPMWRQELMATVARYDITNPEIRQIGNPYYHWDALSVPSKELFTQKSSQLYQDAQAFFRQHPVPERASRPEPVTVSQAWLDGTSRYPYPPPNPEFNDQVLKRALANRNTPLGNGVIFGEDHTNAAARSALTARIDDLHARGVKTLYLEALLRDDAPAELRNFNLTGEISDKLRDQLTKGNADHAMIDLVTRAHEKGMKIVALDSLAAWISPGAVYDGGVRMTTMNYSAFNIIRAEQMANGHLPWVALVGANHGKRSYGVPGINELTGAISVSAAYASSAYGLARNNLDFSLAVPFPI